MIVDGVFVVYHYVFTTDTMVRSHSLVKANTKEEALEIYNSTRASRNPYPNNDTTVPSEAKLGDVFPLTTIN